MDTEKRKPLPLIDITKHNYCDSCYRTATEQEEQGAYEIEFQRTKKKVKLCEQCFIQLYEEVGNCLMSMTVRPKQEAVMDECKNSFRQMTEKEAIAIINNAISESENAIARISKVQELAERKNIIGEYYSNIQNCKKEIESCKTAIKALEEIQQYREIGTVEECREAVEKQRSKKILPGIYGL